MPRNRRVTRVSPRTPALRLVKRRLVQPIRAIATVRPHRLLKPMRRPVMKTGSGAIQVPVPTATSVPRDADAHSVNPHMDNRELPTSLSRYMRDAVQEPLLTVAEEIRLAALIKRGDEAARDRMIRANLRLVIKIAREYEGIGLPLLDLINEGNIGLMKAVERFDPAKGGKLSTYGAWWIKQSIRRALTNQSKTIRLPVHAMERLWAIKKVTARYEEEIGREPTNAELATELGTSVGRIAAIREANVRPASLDAPIGADADSSRLGDVIEDPQAITPYEDLEQQTVRETVAELLHKLPEREVVILKQRFGLDDSDSKVTLRQIGKRFGVTRERIRQLQNLALQKLRAMMIEREALPEAA